MDGENIEKRVETIRIEEKLPSSYFGESEERKAWQKTYFDLRIRLGAHHYLAFIFPFPCALP